MKIAIVAGSHRKNSESERVGRYIEKELSSLACSPWLLSLADNPLPLWDEGVWSGEEKWTTLWNPISEQLSASDGLVVISPEWGGMAPAALKNFFLLCGNNEIADKPAMIVGVSSGIGGSYPISELRTSSYKNTRVCFIPDHVIVRTSEKMLGQGAPTDSHDESLRKRMNYSLKMLIEYSKALKNVRGSGVPDYKSFPFGM